MLRDIKRNQGGIFKVKTFVLRTLL